MKRVVLLSTICLVAKTSTAQSISGCVIDEQAQPSRQGRREPLGIRCMQMICAHSGKKYNQDFLSNICHATTQGVSLLGIRDAAVKLFLG